MVENNNNDNNMILNDNPMLNKPKSKSKIKYNEFSLKGEKIESNHSSYSMVGSKLSTKLSSIKISNPFFSMKKKDNDNNNEINGIQLSDIKNSKKKIDLILSKRDVNTDLVIKNDSSSNK